MGSFWQTGALDLDVLLSCFSILKAAFVKNGKLETSLLNCFFENNNYTIRPSVNIVRTTENDLIGAMKQTNETKRRGE